MSATCTQRPSTSALMGAENHSRLPHTKSGAEPCALPQCDFQTVPKRGSLVTTYARQQRFGVPDLVANPVCVAIFLACAWETRSNPGGGAARALPWNVSPTSRAEKRADKPPQKRMPA